MVLFREYLAWVTPEHDVTRLRRSKRREMSQDVTGVSTVKEFSGRIRFDLDDLAKAESFF
jgi:hypothetical protein